MNMTLYRPSLTLYEQKLRDEVIYLHSLWHQGPPSPSNPQTLTGTTPINSAAPKTKTKSKQTTIPSASTSTSTLHVSKPKAFKTTRKTKPTIKNAMTLNHDNPLGSGSTHQEDPVCPCNTPPLSSSPPGWPISNLVPSPLTLPVLDLDQSRMAALKMQHEFFKPCHEFFTRTAHLDGNRDVELEEQDRRLDDNDVEESDAFKFFLGLFEENQQLREFYDKSRESGDFYCLVCGGLGQRVNETFKGCSNLVQHATEISKIKSKVSHTAFGQAICRILGWDINRLPVVVLNVEPPSRTVANWGETEESEQSLMSNVKWTCPKPVESLSTSLGWPTWQLQTTSVICQDPAKDRAGVSAWQLQQKFLEKCRKFLTGQSDSDESEDDEDEDNSVEVDGYEECKEFKFFLTLFDEGKELRNYYENHHEGGEFSCLVCGAIGKKGWKRYNGCLGLLQHAITVSRTKKMRAHRAYGKVICKVLGWDVDRLPSIVLKGEPLGHPLTKTSTLLSETMGNANYSNEASILSINNSESIYDNNKKLVTVRDSDNHLKTGVLPICESSLLKDDAGKHATATDNEHSMAKKAEAVDCKKNSQDEGRNYKKKNIEFWVNNHCWPEERLNQSMLRLGSQKKASGSDLTEDHNAS